MPTTAATKADICANAIDPPLVRAAWMTLLEGYTITDLVRDRFSANKFLVCRIVV